MRQTVYRNGSEQFNDARMVEKIQIPKSIRNLFA
jgi:hypothetical protein